MCYQEIHVTTFTSKKIDILFYKLRKLNLKKVLKGRPVHVAPACIGSGEVSTTLGLMYTTFTTFLQETVSRT
jgi:hypothetical protein